MQKIDFLDTSWPHIFSLLGNDEKLKESKNNFQALSHWRKLQQTEAEHSRTNDGIMESRELIKFAQRI